MSDKQQWFEEWYEGRVKLWQNLRDALNALEEAGEKPGLNVIEKDGSVLRRYVDGESAQVVHCDDGNPWTLDLAVNACNPDSYKPGDRVMYDGGGGTVAEVHVQEPANRLTVQWDNGRRSVIWVSDIMLAGHEAP